MKKILFPILFLVIILGMSNCQDEIKNPVTVNFDTDGGSEIPSQIVDYNSKIPLPKDPVKEGYEFEGWHKDYRDGQLLYERPISELYPDYESIKDNGITLYAKFVKYYNQEVSNISHKIDKEVSEWHTGLNPPYVRVTFTWDKPIDNNFKRVIFNGEGIPTVVDIDFLIIEERITPVQKIVVFYCEDEDGNRSRGVQYRYVINYDNLK